MLSLAETGAGKESRTPDLNLGKVALYQLSYSRVEQPIIIAQEGPAVKTGGLRASQATTLAIESATYSILRELSAATQILPVLIAYTEYSLRSRAT